MRGAENNVEDPAYAEDQGNPWGSVAYFGMTAVG